jgi:hypothetical protein
MRVPAPAQQAAHTFVRTFLRYERGDISASVARSIRSLATAPIARSLLHDPPHSPAYAEPPPPGRLMRLGGADSVRGGAIELTAWLDHGGQRSSLLLTLKRRRGRWLITDLG